MFLNNIQDGLAYSSTLKKLFEVFPIYSNPHLHYQESHIPPIEQNITS